MSEPLNLRPAEEVIDAMFAPYRKRIAELERGNAELREALEAIRLATCDYTTGTRAGLASAHKLATDALKKYARAANASEKENKRG